MFSTRLHQHINAPRAAVFAALLDPGAVGRWRVPAGMTAQVHEFDAREGGRFRVSLSYDDGQGIGKSEGRTDTYHGWFEQIVPNRQVVEKIEFEAMSPQLLRTMTITTTLQDAGKGTDVLMVHDGVPDAVKAEDNEAGMRMALANLAVLVEGGDRAER